MRRKENCAAIGLVLLRCSAAALARRPAL